MIDGVIKNVTRGKMKAYISCASGYFVIGMSDSLIECSMVADCRLLPAGSKANGGELLPKRSGVVMWSCRIETEQH